MIELVIESVREHQNRPFSRNCPCQPRCPIDTNPTCPRVWPKPLSTFPANLYLSKYPLNIVIVTPPKQSCEHKLQIWTQKLLWSGKVTLSYLVKRRQNRCWGTLQGSETMCTPESHSNKEYGTSQQSSIIHVHSNIKTTKLNQIIV